MILTKNKLSSWQADDILCDLTFFWYKYILTAY